MEKEIRKAEDKRVRVGWKINGYDHSKVGIIKNPEKDKFSLFCNDELLWGINYEKVYSLKIIYMRVVYIAHPIGDDVENNLKKIVQIVRHVNLTEPDVIPFVPYYADCIALVDDIKEERERGLKNHLALLKMRFIDEFRLYGECISYGMGGEIIIAKQFNIPVIPMTEQTKKAYLKF